MEFDVPELVAPTTVGSLGLLPARNADVDPHGPAFQVRGADDDWQNVTNAEFASRVDRLARGFLAAGVQVRDRVALMSSNRIEWTVVDFALLSVGAIVVPVHPGSTVQQVAWILQDSGAVAVVVEAGADAATVATARPQVPRLRDVWQLGGAGTDGLAELEQGAEEITGAELRQRSTGVNRADLATIVYTSGTTGRPRGVALSHGNFLTLAENTVERLRELVEPVDARTLVLLPLAHVLPRFMQVVAIYSRTTLGYGTDETQVVDALGTFRPTYVMAVPNTLERVFGQARQQATADGRTRVFERAVRVARNYSLVTGSGRSPSPLLRAEHALFDRLVYRHLREAVGGRIQAFLCGGAPLGENLGHSLRGFGLPVLEGYGLTETTASATANTPQLNRIGTVGMPLPGTAVRVRDDGEVQIRGVGVFQGYWQDGTVSTDGAVSPDGWLRTGDLGALDEHGFLRIHGRRDDQIVTSAGQTISPATVEQHLNDAALIAHSMVVGDGRPYLGALIALDLQALQRWTDHRELSPMTVAQASRDPQLRRELDEIVRRVNGETPVGATVRSIQILPSELSPRSGHVTPSGKLRRDLVRHDFDDEVQALYTQDDSQVR